MKKIFFLPLLILTSCLNIENVVKYKGTGQVKIYDKPYEVVWEKAVKSVEESNLQIFLVDKSRNLILAQRSMMPITPGERVAIYVEKTTKPNQTKVEVISKKALSADYIAKDWTGYLLEGLDSKLK